MFGEYLLEKTISLHLVALARGLDNILQSNDILPASPGTNLSILSFILHRDFVLYVSKILLI